MLATLTCPSICFQAGSPENPIWNTPAMQNRLKATTCSHPATGMVRSGASFAPVRLTCSCPARRSQFEAIDRPALQALPVQTFEHTEFRKVRVGLDGRFEVDGCVHSAPFALCRQEVELRITAASVEILHRGRRVASHARGSGTEAVIDPQHLEAAHRHFGLWDAARELEWVGTIGPNTRAFLQVLLTAVRIKEQGYRAAGAMKRLEKEAGAERLEAACTRAIGIGANTLASVRSILRTGLDQQRHTDSPHQEAAFEHPNVLGPHSYH